MPTNSQILALACLVTAVASAQQSYELAATPKTVAWGYYWTQAVPVLRIKSGDKVTVHTMITNSPTGLVRAGLDSTRVQQSLRDIYTGVTGAARGPGGHILTGPIFVEGADSGDVLEVRFLSIHPDIGYAYNSFSTRSGFIPEDFTAGKNRIIELDTLTNLAHFAAGIDIPMHPFFGSVGVPATGRDGAAQQRTARNSRRQSRQQGSCRRHHALHPGAHGRRAARDRRWPRRPGER